MTSDWRLMQANESRARRFFILSLLKKTKQSNNFLVHKIKMLNDDLLTNNFMFIGFFKVVLQIIPL